MKRSTNKGSLMQPRGKRGRLHKTARKGPKRPKERGEVVESRPRVYRDGWCYRRMLVACGKSRCRVCGGTRYAHGPYWYALRKVTKRGVTTTRTVYIGKQLMSVRDKQA